MYGKLFESMFSGSLVDAGWEAIVTLQQFVILSDKYGIVDKTPSWIARTTTIPLEIIQKGIDALEKPDPESRTTGEDGRRILRLDESRAWGWKIVNYEKYRSIRNHEERNEYQKELMRRRRADAKPSVSVVSPPLAPVSSVSQGSKQEAEGRCIGNRKRSKDPASRSATEQPSPSIERRLSLHDFWRSLGFKDEYKKFTDQMQPLFDQHTQPELQRGMVAFAAYLKENGGKGTIAMYAKNCVFWMSRNEGPHDMAVGQ